VLTIEKRLHLSVRLPESFVPFATRLLSLTHHHHHHHVVLLPFPGCVAALRPLRPANSEFESSLSVTELE
jgi:hypothetical protein